MSALNCPKCGKKLPTNSLQGFCPECLLQAGFPTGTAPDPGAPTGKKDFIPPTIEELAPVFPQLEIVQLLGQGGMGAVYKARQPALDRLVALKILPPQPESDTGFTERFNREARALAKLSHPNIVAIHDYGHAGKLHYFLMEYVDGGNLRELQEGAKFTPREALRIIPQICEALQYAHDEGIVHRDIKPENVMLDRRGRVKITDFGLAKITGLGEERTRLTGARDVMGTPHYMAPEQVEHPREVDHRADIYSLGVVFYEMLTGELPLGRFAPPSRKVQVDVRLDEVVLHTLEKEPIRRYQNVSEVKRDVDEIATGPAPLPREIPKQAASPISTAGPDKLAHAARVCRYIARGLALASLAFFSFFIVAEGLPAIGTQPLRVQLLFGALGLMLLGFIVGWKRDGAASILIAAGWTIWNGVEGFPKLNLLQTPLPLAFLFAFCWWATHGRRWKPIAIWTGVFILALTLGNTVLPGEALRRAAKRPSPSAQEAPPVAVRGIVVEAATGKPIAGAQVNDVFGHRAQERPARAFRTGGDGRFQLRTWNEGNHWLTASADGYRPANQPYPLLANDDTGVVLLKFQLERSGSPKPAEAGPVFTPANIPPVVISTLPQSGQTNVDHALSELRIMFSRPMAPAWSCVQVDDANFPEVTEQPSFLEDQRTCVVPVRLRPGTTYCLWLNKDELQKFQSTESVPAIPYLLMFKTKE